MENWFRSFGNAHEAVLAVALLWCIAYQIGHVSLKRLRLRPETGATLASLIVGLNVYGLITFLLSVIGFYEVVPARNLLWGLGGVASILTAREGAEAVCSWHRRGRTLDWCWLGLATVVLVLLGPALCHPVHWDEQVYHITVPVRWIAAGRPILFGDLPYSGFPALSEFLFWPLVDAGGIIAPRLLVWCTWALTACAMKILLRRQCGSGPATAIVLAFCLSQTAVHTTLAAYVEFLLVLDVAGLFILLAPYWGEEASTSPPLAWRHAAVVGVVAGGAAAVKLTGAVAIPLALMALLAAMPHHHTRRERVIVLATACCTSLLVAVPFYLRPLIATGNPFYPYFASLFGSTSARMAMSSFHHSLASSYFGVGGVCGFFTGPILLSVTKTLYAGGFGFQFLVLVVMFALALRYLRREGRRWFIWLAMAGLLYVVWFFTSQQARFLLPAVLVVALASGQAVAGMRPHLRRVVTGILLTLSLAGLPFRHAGYVFYSWKCCLGLLEVTSYLATAMRTDGMLPLISATARMTPPSANIMMLWEQRTLYMPRRTLIATPFFQERLFTPPESVHGPADVLAAIRSKGSTHVVLALESKSPDEIPEFLVRCKPVSSAFRQLELEGDLVTLWRSDRFVLFEVR